MTHKKGRLVLVMLFASAVMVAANAFAAIDEGAVNKCKTCHEEVVNKFMAGSHHGKAFSKGDAAVKYSCESCHGPGDKHIAAGGSKETIVSFGKKSAQPAAEQSKQCLSCHGKNKELMMWDVGKHKRNDVSCASCHSTHKEGMAKPNSETCFTCHKDIKTAVAKQSHHPIVEGKVSCNDCHNVHGTLSHGMIRAENNNQLCYKCHADKRGPFMWEHAPVEENCMTCHEAHGSRHSQLLKRKVPQLCQDCHSAAHGQASYNSLQLGFGNSGGSANKFYGKSCVNCHTKIHGSVAPSNPESFYNSGKDFIR